MDLHRAGFREFFIAFRTLGPFPHVDRFQVLFQRRVLRKRFGTFDAVIFLPLVRDSDVVSHRLRAVELFRALGAIESQTFVKAFDVGAQVGRTSESLVALRASVLEVTVGRFAVSSQVSGLFKGRAASVASTFRYGAGAN